MKRQAREDGFTLVELMVVVLIIGILVALAIPVFNAARDSAARSTCHSNMRMIEGAAEQWLAADPGNTRTSLDGDESVWGAILIPGYVKTPPGCPTNGFPYEIAATTSITVVACTDPDGTGVGAGPHPHF